MNVTLNPELERLVREKVQSGEFADADEVVSRALELLKQQPEAAKAGEPSELQAPHGGESDTTRDGRALDLDAFFADIDRSLPPDTPALSPKATTREGIYGDILEPV